MNTLPNPIHGDWADSMSEWAVTHQRVSEAELDRFIAEMHAPAPVLPFGGCDCSLGLAECQCCCRPLPAPAECCSVLLADPDPAPFVFPLEPILTRHPWLGPVLVTCIVVVWMCVDAYLEPTQ